jgi:hypothetical protein
MDSGRKLKNRYPFLFFLKPFTKGQGLLFSEFSDRQSKCRPTGNHWSKPKQMNNEKPEEGVFLSKNDFRHVEIRQINRNFIPDNFLPTCAI